MGLLRRPRADKSVGKKQLIKNDESSCTDFNENLGRPTPESHAGIVDHGIVDNNQIATGPEPFPYRLAKKGGFQSNPLVDFTNAMEETPRPLPGADQNFALQDFLLKRTNTFLPYGDKSKRITSSQARFPVLQFPSFFSVFQLLAVFQFCCSFLYDF